MRLQAKYLQVNGKKETLATRKLRPMLAAVVCDSKYAAGMHRYSLPKQRYKMYKVVRKFMMQVSLRPSFDPSIQSQNRNETWRLSSILLFLSGSQAHDLS
jgi:hypothetical protein